MNVNWKLILMFFVCLGVVSLLFSSLADKPEVKYASENICNNFATGQKGASKHTSASVEAYRSATTDGLGIKMSGRGYSPFSHRSVRYAAGYTQATITPSIASNGGSTVVMGLHTTSSAEYKSFGGGSASGSYDMGGGTNVSQAIQTGTVSGTVYANNSVTPSWNTIKQSGASIEAAVASAHPIAATSAASIYAGGYNKGLIAGTYNSVAYANGYKGGHGVSKILKRSPTLGEADFGAWLNGLADVSGSGFMYEDEEGNAYYDLNVLEQWFKNQETEKGGVVIGGITYTWEDFLAWFYKNGKDSSEGYGDHNDYWRVPITDGTLVLILFGLGYVLCIYLRHRKAIANKTEK